MILIDVELMGQLVMRQLCTIFTSEEPISVVHRKVFMISSLCSKKPYHIPWVFTQADTTISSSSYSHTHSIKSVGEHNSWYMPTIISRPLSCKWCALHVLYPKRSTVAVAIANCTLRSSILILWDRDTNPWICPSFYWVLMTLYRLQKGNKERSTSTKSRRDFPIKASFAWNESINNLLPIPWTHTARALFRT